MNNVKEYLKSLLVEKGVNIDVSDGSPLGDLLINPTAAMLTPTLDQIEYIWEVLGLVTPEIMEEAELDALAANFLITRDPGAKATGVIELLYEAPIELTIPEGTQFYNNAGNIYVTERTYQIPKSNMNLTAYPYYSTGLIPVISRLAGTQYDTEPLTINSCDLTPAPTVVRNTTAIEGGDDKETNRQLATRLYASVRSRTLASSKGIEAALQENFNTIQEISVKGAGNDEMLRDLIFESGLQNSYGYAYHKEDFYGKISGLSEYPHPQSSAYFTYFFDSPTTSGIYLDLPTVDEFILEFSGDDYEGMYSLNDPLKATISNKKLLNATFEGLTTLGPEWLRLDASQNFLEEEIQPINNKVRLGKRYSQEELANSNVNVSVQTMADILTFLQQLKIVGAPPASSGDEQ